MFDLRKRRFQFWIAVLVATGTQLGCGGEGGGRGDTAQPVSPRATGMLVSPTNANVAAGLTQSFAAVLEFSDGSTEDVTAKATWSSSVPAVASLAVGNGNLHALSVGQSTITAAFNGLMATATLTVVPPIVASIVVSPSSAVYPPANGGTLLATREARPFVATAIYSDGTQSDVTGAAQWTTSSTDVVAIDKTLGGNGWVVGVGPGEGEVRAGYGSTIGSLTVDVLHSVALDEFAMPTCGISDPGLDSGGTALAVWFYAFTGSLFGTPPMLLSSTFAPNAGWSQGAALNLGTINDRPGGTLAMNGNGDALLVWAGANGIYAASFTIAGGWSDAQTLLAGESPFGWMGQSVNVSVDDVGNGLAVWADANGTEILGSRYDRALDAWTTPQQLPGGSRGNANGPLSLAMNGAGAAVVLWEAWLSDGTWVANASRFLPGDGEGTGWQAPETLFQSTTYWDQAVAMDAAGDIIAVVADVSPETSVLNMCRYTPGEGWGSVQLIPTIAPDWPAGPALAMNDAGQAVVAWYSADGSVRVSRADPAGNWNSAEELRGATAGGTPTVLRPSITADGRIVVVWRPERIGDPIAVASRFTPGADWATESLPFIGHYGKLYDMRFVGNESGQTLVLWSEENDVWNGQGWDATVSVYVDQSLTF